MNRRNVDNISSQNWQDATFFASGFSDDAKALSQTYKQASANTSRRTGLKKL
jgi:hypothetical protein|tara:strand:- start:1202 stop:1357 length:156 start_codon:yes stop_codon:yes gene_type:complete